MSLRAFEHKQKLPASPFYLSQLEGAKAAAAAAKGLPEEGLHVNVALPLIQQHMARLVFNEVSLLKEAADKQKVLCKFNDRTMPPRADWPIPIYQCMITWQDQVSLTATALDPVAL